MFKPTKLSAGLLLAFGSLAAIPGAVFAQDVPALQRVEVTGSNIARSEAETPSPVQVITAADLKKSGYTTISEVLREITANGQGTLSQGFSGAFAAGASGISLRGLSVGATLVLIDGHRMAPYPLSDDGQRPFVDISSIPFASVERIEILKDGASAVYGSDAIAGVVNVILKKSFEGTLVTAEVGNTTRGGGATRSGSITHGFGTDSDSVNGYLSLEFRKQDEIKLAQRSGDWTNFDWRAQGGRDLRPGANSRPNFVPTVLTPSFQIPGSDINDPANFAFANSGCSYAQAQASNCIYQNTWAQIQPNTENTNLIGRLNAKLGSDWDLTVTGSLFDSKAQQTSQPRSTRETVGGYGGNATLGPGQIPGIASVIDSFTVPANYPGNTLGVPAEIRAFLPGLTPLTTDVDTKATRLVFDLNGSFAGWDIRGSAGFTRVETTQVTTGTINHTALLSALNDPNPATRYSLTNVNSAELNARVQPAVRQVATDDLNFVEARVSRELMKLPGGSLGVSVGTSHVEKKLSAPNPVEVQQGTVFGTSTAFALGSEKNDSLYAELVAPVTKSLELDAAIRYDRYDTYGNSSTPKVGFKFAPIKELTLRGTASQGFRAPSATENGTAGSTFAFNNIRDTALCPVSDANGDPVLDSPLNVPAACDLGPTYLQGTNKELQPEKSRSVTFGFILEPSKEWYSTLDYYKITVDNQIISAASLASFDPLLYAVRGTPQTATYGDGTQRVTPVGAIAFIPIPYVNGQTTETSGLEFETRYKFNLADKSRLTVGLQYTHVFNYDMTLNGKTYNLAGTHGPAIISGDTGNPKDRAQLTFTYENGPLTVATTTNYVSGYDVTDPSNGIDTCSQGLSVYNFQWPNGVAPNQYCSVPAFTYTNLSVQYKVDKGLTLRGSINNLFDVNPPLDFATYGGTGANASSKGTGAPYNPSLHQTGAIGRFISVGLDYRF